MKNLGNALRRFAVWLFRGGAKLWTALIIIACLISWGVVGGLTAAEKVLGITARTVATTSMVPTYNPGDIVWYLPSSGPLGKDLVVGHTLAIAPNGDMNALYTHRVVSVEADGTATLAGDAFVANGVVDIFHPTQADVKGVAFTVTKDATAKWILNTVRSDTVRWILTALGLGTFAMWLIVNFGLNRRDEGKDDQFAARFHEMELDYLERKAASASATADDALAVFADLTTSAPDSQAQSSSRKDTE